MKTKASYWQEWTVPSLFTGNKLTSGKGIISWFALCDTQSVSLMSVTLTVPEVKGHILIAVHMWYFFIMRLPYNELQITIDINFEKPYMQHTHMADINAICSAHLCLFPVWIINQKEGNILHAITFVLLLGMECKFACIWSWGNLLYLTSCPHKLSPLVLLTQKRFATENKWAP